MNMINGIIITTFGALREDHEKRMEDQEDKCFICSLNRTQFENRKIPFDHHRNCDHNYDNYIKYFVSLRLKNEKDLDSDESYIVDCMKKKDIAFFPIKRSYSLGNVEEEDKKD